MRPNPKGQRHGRIKPKRYQDPAHLVMVRQLPCVVCGDNRSDIDRAAHHILRGVVRGMGLKAGDDKVIPLCSECHADTHLDGNETDYLTSYGIENPVELARKLYECTGSYASMINVINGAREL